MSIWGRSVAEFGAAGARLSRVEALTAVEVNVSCPNVEDGRMFAHSATATAAAVAAVADACPDLPCWAKLSPSVPDLPAIAGAALDAGAEAVTLINTAPGSAIDLDECRPVLGAGAGSGGLSGPAIHPLAVRAVADVRAALPAAAIVGVGGIMHGTDAVEMLMAGADAVQVGTATFRDPRAPSTVLAELEQWCARHGFRQVRDLVGAAVGERAGPV